MARNKTSKFGAAEGLFVTQEQEALDVQNVHEVQEEKNIKGTKMVQQVQDVHEEMPATQGKKGAKAKRLNLAYSDANYEYISKESRKRGLTMTQFLNDIIATYREYNMELYKTHSKNCQGRWKWEYYWCERRRNGYKRNCKRNGIFM